MLDKISACIITKNESQKLIRCLAAINTFGFELVVVDTGSTDNTKQAVKKYTDAVYDFLWCDDFAAAKNYAISMAKNDMVLVIDSDEYIKPCGADGIQLLEKRIKEHPGEVGRIQRSNTYLQNGEVRVNREWLNRLFDRRLFHYEGRIHEQVVSGSVFEYKGGRSEEDIGYASYQTNLQIDHDGYGGSREERDRKAERNIRLLLQEFEADGQNTYLMYQLGKSYYMLGDYPASIRYFERALGYDLDTGLEYVIDMVETYGYALLNCKRAETAILFEGIYAEFGRTADFQFLMGLIYMNNERFDEAVAEFLKAAEHGDARTDGVNSYLAYYNAGVIRECLGDRVGAEELYRKCGTYERAKERLEVLERLQFPKIAIVILSYNTLEETRECIASIRKNVRQCSYELVIVDNASEDGSVEWLKQQPDIKLLCNQVNAGFPAACNQGIAMADADADILLLNSDTLVPENALEYLQTALYSSEKAGAAGSITNWASNYQNIADQSVTAENYEAYARLVNVPMEHPYEKKLWLVGYALLLKRTALDRIGLLDERFSPGNYEDTDLGFRMLFAGYEQLLCRNSFIFHYGSRSFGKKKERFENLLKQNEERFVEKWNFHPYRYSYIKVELLSFIPFTADQHFSVLDVGCGMGATMARLQWMYPNMAIDGVEIRTDICRAAEQMGRVWNADITDFLHMETRKRYDIVLSGGVLEYQTDLRQYLAALKQALKETGIVIGSFYNRDCRCLEKEAGKNYYTGEQFLDIALSLQYKVEQFSFVSKEGEQYQYVFVLS